jgi:hypothetical protein
MDKNMVELALNMLVDQPKNERGFSIEAGVSSAHHCYVLDAYVLYDLVVNVASRYLSWCAMVGRFLR